MILLMMADLFELTESRQSASKSMNYVTQSYVSLSLAICRAMHYINIRTKKGSKIE